MANALYDFGRTHFGIADINWPADDIRGWLVDHNDYTAFNLTTNEKLVSVATIARVKEAALTGKTIVGGVCDATDLTFTAVSGDLSEDVILGKYIATGVAPGDDSLLMVFIDQATGLPVQPNTGDIVVRWSETGNKIFKL